MKILGRCPEEEEEAGMDEEAMDLIGRSGGRGK